MQCVGSVGEAPSPRPLLTPPPRRDATQRASRPAKRAVPNESKKDPLARNAFGTRVERGAKGWCDMNQNLKRSRLVLSRGASMVEYALLLVAVLLLAAGAMKALGPKVGQAAVNTTNML